MVELGYLVFFAALCLPSTSGKVADAVASPVVHDVTTIYKLSEAGVKIEDAVVEIHARTNALGLVPITQDGFLEPVNHKSELLCWYWGGTKCDWETDNFYWEPTQSYGGLEKSPTALFETEIMVKGCKDPRSNVLGFNMYYNRSHSYNLRSSAKSCTVNVSPSLFKPRADPAYQIKMVSKCSSCLIRGSFSFCSRYNNQYTCSEEQTFDVGSVTKPIFWIETKDKRIKMWLGKERTKLLVDYEDSVFVLPNSKKLVTFNVDSPLAKPTAFNHQVLQSHEKASKLISPKVTLQDHFCLTAMFHLEKSDLYLLKASAVDATNQRELLKLGTYQSNKAGFHSWQIQYSVPKHLKKKTVNIVLETLTSSTISIHRIASCNFEDGDEVFLINSTLLASEDIKKKAFNMSFGPTKRTDHSRPQICNNDGVLTSAGCACPAGFKGENCSQGCGPNRFGQDCLGECSVYGSQCRGLLLCTIGAGCHCAPGYHGPLCDNVCDDGKYGVDCRQTCDHVYCQGQCDKYSGRCTKCLPGYHPPHCSDKYIHLKKAPILSSNKYGTISVAVDFSQELMEGSGQPVYYQVQYKVRGSESWTVYSTRRVAKQPYTGTEVVEMVALQSGEEHQVRVILLAENYDSYQGEDIPTASIYTKCYIPDSYNYNISLTYCEQPDHLKCLRVKWDYSREEHWCDVVSYEIRRKEGWKWVSESKPKDENYHNMSNILPGKELQFKVRALTKSGYAPFSETVTSTSPDEGVCPVKNLKLVSADNNNVIVSWDPTAEAERKSVNYTVTYTCVKRLACTSPCGSSSSVFFTDSTSISLSSLLAAAQYEISVSADAGRQAFLTVGTPESGPDEAPVASEKEIIRTNSSLTVFWDPVLQLCSGFLKSYYYELFLAKTPDSTVQSGDTLNTNVTFSKLRASTDYVVKVYVKTGTLHDWKPARYLLLNATTTAARPEQVEELTVYKRGRSMVGLRWKEPSAMNGLLESFTVSYVEDTQVKSVKIKPTACQLWPHLYCYVVEDLKPSKTYNFSVGARNRHIYEDGEEAFVLGQTRESAPTAPVNLTVCKITDTSLGLQWEHPDLANGVLRSFIITIEELEQFDQSKCCDEYPLIVMSTNSEQPIYQTEVAGLHPASNYTVSVTAMTTSLGPTQTVSAATSPPVISVTPPRVDIIGANTAEWKWLPQTRIPEVNTSQVYDALVKSHILLVITNNPVSDSGIKDARLEHLLKKEISTPFYFAAEYNKDDKVVVGSGSNGDSDWGHFSNPTLELDQVYQLAAVQIAEHNKIISVDIVLSTKISWILLESPATTMDTTFDDIISILQHV